MSASEVGRFLAAWEREAARTEQLLAALPPGQYDFRPDPGGRSLGELAWHLAEVDAYMSLVVEQGGYRPEVRPPNLERPRTVEALAPAYALAHADAVRRIAALTDAELARELPVFSEPMSIRTILWDGILGHAIHHRGQLALMCRLAGARPPAPYGPDREGMAALRKRAE